jgi:hypothetical protein
MHLALPDKLLDLALKVEAPDDDAGENSDKETGDDIDECNLPAEHGKQHGYGDLVDQRRCYQE